MSRILGAVKATYNFFAGDAILLAAAIIAFVLAYALNQVHGIAPAVPAMLFVAEIMLGLVATLAREAAGRPRHR